MKLPWYILPIVAFVAGLLVGWQGCERKADPEVITKIDTVRTTKVELIQLDPVSIEVPIPYEVVKYVPTKADPPNFELDLLRTYVDTVEFPGLRLGYNIQTRGTLEGALFSPEYERETIIEEIYIREREEAKPLRGIYLGLTVGGNKSEFGTLAPGLDYVSRRVLVGANYNLMDQTVNVRVGRKLF